MSDMFDSCSNVWGVPVVPADLLQGHTQPHIESFLPTFHCCLIALQSSLPAQVVHWVCPSHSDPCIVLSRCKSCWPPCYCRILYHVHVCVPCVCGGTLHVCVYAHTLGSKSSANGMPWVLSEFAPLPSTMYMYMYMYSCTCNCFNSCTACLVYM